MQRSSHPFPLFERLEIESQSNCNRDCWFCPRPYDRSGVYLDAGGKPVLARMPTEKLLDLLDQAQGMGFDGLVSFYYFSEPLLDDRCLLLVQEARSRGMKPFMHTNGDVLRHNPGLCRDVERAYDLIVVGLYDYATAADLEDAKREWHQRLPMADLRFSYIAGGEPRSAPSMAVPRPLVPSDPRFAIPDFVYPNAPCMRPRIRMLIRYDGAVCNCCEDINAEFGLGNVQDATLADIWFSEHHVEVVEDLMAGNRESYALCRTCPASPTSARPDGAKLVMRRRAHPD